MRANPYDQVRPPPLSSTFAYRSQLVVYSQQLKAVRQFQRVNDVIGTVSTFLLQDAVNPNISPASKFLTSPTTCGIKELQVIAMPIPAVIRFNSCVTVQAA